METTSLLSYLLVALFALSFSSFICKRLNHMPRERRPSIPPGSVGWPYVGETLQLYSESPHVFFTSRQRRYGEIFKTRILGCPCVMLASPEAIKFVLVTQSALFKPSYPPSKETLIGPSALFFHQGSYHTIVRKLVQSSLSLDVVRNIIPEIETIVASALGSWSKGGVINTFHKMKELAFDVAVLTTFGGLTTHYKDLLKKNYFILDKGYNSFPIKLPGTLYSKSLTARKRLRQIIRDIMHQRKQERSVRRDLLDALMSFEGERNERLSNDQIVDNVIGVLFAAQDTTASLLSWILKYIHDDPKLLEAIEEEHKEIYEMNDGGRRPLTWTQIRKMHLTNRVMLESLRMSSIISFTYREATEDVEYKGYLIPKGWKVLPSFRILHHNPEFFSDPQIFDPSRFEINLKPNTFMPFGLGAHACPGNEVAKLQCLILIHHLVTNFRFEVVGSKDGADYAPFPVPGHGLPARLWKEPSRTTCLDGD